MSRIRRSCSKNMDCKCQVSRYCLYGRASVVYNGRTFGDDGSNKIGRGSSGSYGGILFEFYEGESGRQGGDDHIGSTKRGRTMAV